MQQPRPRGRPAYPDILTPAEWRVAEFVRHGLSNRAIAELQGVSTDAVKFHVANVLGKLGMARRAELRTWQGINADSRLIRRGEPAESDGDLKGIGQIARNVADVAAAARWYADVLGLPHLYTYGKMAFFDCGDVRLLLSEGGDHSASIMYFRVFDIHAAQAALVGRGVEFVAAPHIVHRHPDGVEEWMAFFNDNESRPLGLTAQVRGASSTDQENTQ